LAPRSPVQRGRLARGDTVRLQILNARSAKCLLPSALLTTSVAADVWVAHAGVLERRDGDGALVDPV
jgi:hypothetical protein